MFNFEQLLRSAGLRIIQVLRAEDCEDDAEAADYGLCGACDQPFDQVIITDCGTFRWCMFCTGDDDEDEAEDEEE